MSHSGKKSSNEVRIMQFNQMKGVREGRKEEVREDSEGVVISGQLGVKLPGEYMVAVVENGTIVEWRKAEMLDMRCTAIKEQEKETKTQKWSLEHKKNMVSQFGTSKSKRKLNQMMNNIIE